MCVYNVVMRVSFHSTCRQNEYIMYLVVWIIQVDNGPSVTKGNLHPVSRLIHIS